MQKNKTPHTLIEMLLQVADLFDEYADICEQMIAKQTEELQASQASLINRGN